MSHLKTSLWHHAGDLRRMRPGRTDSPLLAEECLDYLGEFHRDKILTDSPELARRATREVQSARIRSLLTVRSQQDLVLTVRSQQDLERRLERQEETIARLLAFVPARVAEISPERVEQIVAKLVRYASECFDRAPISVTALQETDHDTIACHRIQINFPVENGYDPEEFARNVFKVHEFAAENLATAEYQAIRLIIELQASPASEP